MNGLLLFGVLLGTIAFGWFLRILFVRTVEAELVEGCPLRPCRRCSHFRYDCDGDRAAQEMQS